MIERFRYHARAFGVTIDVKLPFDATAPVQAALDLAPEGGFDNTSVLNYNFRDIVFFSSATTVVAGSQSDTDGTFDSLATTTIEGFNVLGVVTADKIVSRITAIHPQEGGPPTILPTGSHFENLRIAGHPVTIDLATDTFTRLGTAQQIRDAYRENKEGFRDEFHALTQLGKESSIVERLQSYFPWKSHKPTGELPEREGEIRCGLVRGISGLSSDIPCHGNTIYVRGFGVIRLAEIVISDSLRRLTMIDIDLGSTPKGHVSGGGVEGNGSGW
jgi:hypothetical protein